ncbi:hypothetical protein COEREDRAFT_89775 [Coemansia reversa NRRL 1564]|uniref:Uncharacterized protein n=1 Tax=Coemansia reversa (strain ATCC 12441 / NRRL 1564) TaxID=763665 RepID=A0A2G5B3A8_COERN|nr:hypothetical protein COEREDRAFT_89775 [Coemansia reversa NRRL 1564]|eukprot:PIA13197.1 hypothetical protein COEREDRAFT_89775 [Coemansia reversa NRRL 1564]
MSTSEYKEMLLNLLKEKSKNIPEAEIGIIIIIRSATFTDDLRVEKLVEMLIEMVESTDIEWTTEEIKIVITYFLSTVKIKDNNYVGVECIFKDDTSYFFLVTRNRNVVEQIKSYLKLTKLRNESEVKKYKLMDTDEEEMWNQQNEDFSSEDMHKTSDTFIDDQSNFFSNNSEMETYNPYGYCVLPSASETLRISERISVSYSVMAYFDTGLSKLNYNSYSDVVGINISRKLLIDVILHNHFENHHQWLRRYEHYQLTVNGRSEKHTAENEYNYAFTDEDYQQKIYNVELLFTHVEVFYRFHERESSKSVFVEQPITSVKIIQEILKNNKELEGGASDFELRTCHDTIIDSDYSLYPNTMLHYNIHLRLRYIFMTLNIVEINNIKKDYNIQVRHEEPISSIMDKIMELLHKKNPYYYENKQVQSFTTRSGKRIFTRVDEPLNSIKTNGDDQYKKIMKIRVTLETL